MTDPLDRVLLQTLADMSESLQDGDALLRKAIDLGVFGSKKRPELDLRDRSRLVDTANKIFRSLRR